MREFKRDLVIGGISGLVLLGLPWVIGSIFLYLKGW